MIGGEGGFCPRGGKVLADTLGEVCEWKFCMSGKFIVLTYRKKCSKGNSIGGRTFNIYCFTWGKRAGLRFLD